MSQRTESRAISVSESHPYRVRVVVDLSFGERLALLPPREPVWIVESPANTPVLRRLWSERLDANHLTGITVIQPATSGLPEDSLLAVLDTIDLHHGRYSADPPYSELEVIGLPVTERVRDVLDELGLTVILQSEDGFLASRA